eukprot:Em0001g3078a
MAALACKKGFTFKSNTLCIDAGFEQLNEAASSDENDEMDPDEEIMRLMSTIDSKGNYKPFKSNVAAMAYLLAHSPRPMSNYSRHLESTNIKLNLFCASSVTILVLHSCAVTWRLPLICSAEYAISRRKCTTLSQIQRIKSA